MRYIFQFACLCLELLKAGWWLRLVEMNLVLFAHIVICSHACKLSIQMTNALVESDKPELGRRAWFISASHKITRDSCCSELHSGLQGGGYFVSLLA